MNLRRSFGVPLCMKRVFFSVLVASLGALQVQLAWPCLRNWPDSDAVFLAANFSGIFGAANVVLLRPKAQIAGSVFRCSVMLFAALLSFQFFWFVTWGASRCTGPMPILASFRLCLDFGWPSLAAGWLVHRRWRALRRRDVEDAQRS